MSRARSWVFTINNYDGVDVDAVDAVDAQYGLYAYEVGEQGTPHLQGYLYFTNAKTMTSVKKKLPRAHLEVAKGSHSDNVSYIKGPYTSKDGLKTKPANPNFKEWGQPPSQGERNDLCQFKKDIDNGKRGSELDLSIRAKYPKLEATLITEAMKHDAVEQYKSSNFMEVHVRWGPPGVGKTRYIYDKHGADKCYRVVLGDGSKGSLWFNNYNGEEALILDDFNGEIPFKYFLQLMDIYPFQMQTKGGTVWRTSKYLYITSNRHPDHWYKTNEDDIAAMFRRFTSCTEIAPTGRQERPVRAGRQERPSPETTKPTEGAITHG